MGTKIFSLQQCVCGLFFQPTIYLMHRIYGFCSEECQSNNPIPKIDNRYDIQFKSIINRNTEAFICWQDREFGHSSQYLISINDGGNRRSLFIIGYYEMDILVFYANEAIKWFRRPSYGQTFDTCSSTLSMFISYAGCGSWRIRLDTKDSFFAYLFDHKANAVNNKSIKPLKWEDMLGLDSKNLKVKRKRKLVGSINDINIYLSEDALIATLTVLSKFSRYDDQSQVALIASSTTYNNIEYKWLFGSKQDQILLLNPEFDRSAQILDIVKCAGQHFDLLLNLGEVSNPITNGLPVIK